MSRRSSGGNAFPIRRVSGTTFSIVAFCGNLGTKTADSEGWGFYSPTSGLAICLLQSPNPSRHVVRNAAE